MTEYQEFVAGKAQALVTLMDQIGKTDREVSELLVAMRPKLDLLTRGEVSFPSEIIVGYALYFSPDAFNGIYDAYPGLVDAKADLAFALRRADMDSYLGAERYLRGLSP